jgi:3-hydroxy-9,10-secoandrosta-1,3,5(10)-triene-9,17-dione monooxygenase reductase component
MPGQDPPDPAGFRTVLGHFATGVAAVAGLHEGDPTGLVATSFTAVSLHPPLVSFCVARTSVTWPRLRSGAGVCVSFLSAAQLDHARRLAVSGGSKLRDLSWTPSPTGLPIVDGALAWLECAVKAEHSAGDHVIVVALVRGLGDRPGPADPLVLYRGRYGGFTLTTDSG